MENFELFDALISKTEKEIKSTTRKVNSLEVKDYITSSLSYDYSDLFSTPKTTHHQSKLVKANTPSNTTQPESANSIDVKTYISQKYSRNELERK